MRTSKAAAFGFRAAGDVGLAQRLQVLGRAEIPVPVWHGGG
jgi:hypothetical protein